jgi:hypothetical protein
VAHPVGPSHGTACWPPLPWYGLLAHSPFGLVLQGCSCKVGPLAFPLGLSEASSWKGRWGLSLSPWPRRGLFLEWCSCKLGPLVFPFGLSGVSSWMCSPAMWCLLLFPLASLRLLLGGVQLVASLGLSLFPSCLADLFFGGMLLQMPLAFPPWFLGGLFPQGCALARWPLAFHFATPVVRPVGPSLLAARPVGTPHGTACWPTPFTVRPIAPPRPYVRPGGPQKARVNPIGGTIGTHTKTHTKTAKTAQNRTHYFKGRFAGPLPSTAFTNASITIVFLLLVVLLLL